MEEGGPLRGSRPGERPVERRAVRQSPEPAYRQQPESPQAFRADDSLDDEPAASRLRQSSRRHKKRAEKAPREGGRRAWPLVLVILILGILALGAGAYVFWAQQQPQATAINDSDYQAVFLAGGQTYYGKLKILNNQSLELTDIYYLQSQSSQSGSSSSQQSSTSSSSDVQLIKLGNEIYGPEDMMVINKSQVLYYQNLNPQGKVTKAILSYQQSH